MDTIRSTDGENFNPRSHEGSDSHVLVIGPVGSNFNPRSHEGSDIASDIPADLKAISIHAPTRGATFHMPCMAAAR